MAGQLDRLGAQTTLLYGLPLLGGPRASVDHPRSAAVRTPVISGRWERMPGGWRIKRLEFALFERAALRWALKRRADFDVVQVCELPCLVAALKMAEPDWPVVMRMTSPIYHDPVGGVQKADALIASGTSLKHFRAGSRPDCVDIPNGVDVERFRPWWEGGLTTEGAETRMREGETTDYTDCTDGGQVPGSSFLVRGCGGRGDASPGKTEVLGHGWTRMDTDGRGIAEGRPSNQEPRTKNEEPTTQQLSNSATQQPGNRTTLRKQLGISPDAFVVIHVGRFVAVKNHAMLVKGFAAFAKAHPGARLMLVGSGPEEGAVDRLIRSLGLGDAVLRLGEQPYARMPERYAAADAMALTSDYESFSFTALEAMASGLPLVVTDTEWVPTLIGESGGRVIPRGDAEALARAFDQMAADVGLQRRMGEANRETVCDRYGWDASARKLMNVYSDVVKDVG